MPIEIRTLGGYGEVGKNCTAIKIDDDVLILDIGLHLENYIQYTDDDDLEKVSTNQLTQAKVIPDISYISDWRKNVKAIIATHAHLDHLGGIPYLASKFDADILATPYTCEVLKKILADEEISVPNKIKKINPNSKFQISDNVTIEFVNATHSTPQTAMLAIHTKYGILVYANDFKFDLSPTLGLKPSFAKLEELGKKGVIALLVECLYSGYQRKTPSEKVAKEMLKEVLLGTNNQGKAIIVTTFSSHLARLQSIIEMAKKLGRKPVFLGRSLAKYVTAGEDAGIVKFSKEAHIVNFSGKIKKELKAVLDEGKDKYLLVVTGHQGEPKSVLSRMVKGEFNFTSGDIVIFSCQIIPCQINIDNRKNLEYKLRERGVRIFTDIHTSGHASKEDLRDLIALLKPKNLIPAHGDDKMMNDFTVLSVEMGYELSKNLHLLKNNQELIL